MKKIIKYGVLGLAGYLILLNMQPYLDISRLLLGTITDVPFLGFLSSLPLVGSLIKLLGMLAADVFGILLWCFIQIVEILPQYMKGDLNQLRQVIFAFGRHREQEISKEDSDAVRRLKQRYNSAPGRWLRTADYLAALMYFIDFALCCMRFPPYQGGLTGFMNDQWFWTLDKVDWGNLISLLFTMYGLELLIMFLLWFFRGQQYFMQQAEQPSGYGKSYGSTGGFDEL